MCLNQHDNNRCTYIVVHLYLCMSVYIKQLLTSLHNLVKVKSNFCFVNEQVLFN